MQQLARCAVRKYKEFELLSQTVFSVCTHHSTIPISTIYCMFSVCLLAGFLPYFQVWPIGTGITPFWKRYKQFFSRHKHFQKSCKVWTLLSDNTSSSFQAYPGLYCLEILVHCMPTILWPFLGLTLKSSSDPNLIYFSSATHTIRTSKLQFRCFHLKILFDFTLPISVYVSLLTVLLPAFQDLLDFSDCQALFTMRRQQ